MTIKAELKSNARKMSQRLGNSDMPLLLFKAMNAADKTMDHLELSDEEGQDIHYVHARAEVKCIIEQLDRILSILKTDITVPCENPRQSVVQLVLKGRHILNATFHKMKDILLNNKGTKDFTPTDYSTWFSASRECFRQAYDKLKQY